MNAYRVVIPPEAERALRDMVLYIAQDSTDNALAWEDRLRGAIQQISDLPNGYAVDDAASERFGAIVRKVVFERTYLIFSSSTTTINRR